MKTANYFLITLFTAFLLAGCSKDDDNSLPDKKDSDIDLSHSFTLTGDNAYQFFVNGQEFNGAFRILGSLNNHLYLPIDMMNSAFSSVGGLILPKQNGVYDSGFDFGPANGTYGNHAFLNAWHDIEGHRYYTYSSHAYGFLADERIDGTDSKFKISNFSGDYVTYRLHGFTLTGFIGEADVLFAGTFKTRDGSKSVKIERGQMKIRAELPDGAEIVQ